ncbi:hypothetical protein AMATHDRAFT_67826 [Amanita thiersii Skay4041]|uniref:BTB domain-containing protein n=1 Tax=Amanita thiersii Skay4041 TaxID=703135 RepID=A0A2A9NBD6_9AGAR|nr:hypothetical protein AMATHDRAFT_67826 [Amanita thiersii Skay4041]
MTAAAASSSSSASASSASATTASTRDDEYYFQDIIFLVEGRLFKVPKHMFIQESQLFRTMLSLPVPNGTPADGSSDDHPLKLDGVKAADFTHILRCLYPMRQFSAPTKGPGRYIKKLEEWLAIFRLAAMWDMEAVRAKAVSELTPLLTNKPALQVSLAVEHQVTEWLVPGLNKLVQREDPIDREDINMIGLDFALKVMTLREDCAAMHSNSRTLRRGAISVDVSDEIRTRFKIRE